MPIEVSLRRFNPNRSDDLQAVLQMFQKTVYALLLAKKATHPPGEVPKKRRKAQEQVEREIKGKGKMKTYFLNNTPPPATPDRDAPSRPATCPALQLSAGEAGMMIEAGAVRRAPTLEGGSSSPRHSGVSFEGDSCPEERASRDSWGDQGDQGDQRSGSCPADIRPDAIESSGSVGPTPPLSCCEC